MPLWAKSGETTPHHGLSITYLEVFQYLPIPIKTGLYKEHGFTHIKYMYILHVYLENI